MGTPHGFFVPPSAPPPPTFPRRNREPHFQMAQAPNTTLVASALSYLPSCTITSGRYVALLRVFWRSTNSRMKPCSPTCESTEVNDSQCESTQQFEQHCDADELVVCVLLCHRRWSATPLQSTCRVCLADYITILMPTS